LSTLADRLRAARERAEYTQSDLARLIPCSQMTVAQWESGNRTINHKDLYRVCQILDVSSDYLIGLKGERE